MFKAIKNIQPHELLTLSKTSVTLAAQTLSLSVAAGINMAVATNALPPEAAYIANFCEKMDQFFDTFDSQKRSIKETVNILSYYYQSSKAYRHLKNLFFHQVNA